MKSLPDKLSELKPAPYNPRTIDQKSFDGLQMSIETFGDLSGITYNRRTGHLVSGHQRVQVLSMNGGDLKIKYSGKDSTHGVIEYDKMTFAVRIVDWDENTEKMANIAANNPAIAGVFTEGIHELIDSLKIVLPDMSTELRLEELSFELDHLKDRSGEFKPVSPEEQPRLDQRAPITCPHCGESFVM